MSKPTPGAWAVGTTWSFELVDTDGRPAGAVVLKLTDKAADICVTGDFHVAKLVSSTTSRFPLENWYREMGLFPAYQIRGARIEVQLNAAICDDYLMILGELNEDGASGRVFSEGLLSYSEHGSFDAKRAVDN